MANGSLASIERALEALRREDLVRVRRTVGRVDGERLVADGRTLVNFASNDYLGLAGHPRLKNAAIAATRDWGTGSGASALVTGHSRLHEEAEEAFARFTGQPRALLFPSGYGANLGILASLADRHGEIFADHLNHACLNDGALLSRATVHRYPHGDLDALEAALDRSRASTKVIATDAVFSMDGDIADVPRLAGLAERHGAWLVLDDAHGIGVLGGGRGTPAHFGVRSDRLVHMATLGKAMGGHGAFVAGHGTVIEWLVQKARTYVFSTALPPALAAVAREAIAVLEEDTGPVTRLGERIATFREACRDAGIATVSTTAIQPVVVGEASKALALSERLREAGLLVPAIRPPTVPAGTSRLRVSLSALHTDEQVRTLAAALAAALGDARA